MKTLIAVVNCRSRQTTWADIVRRTWMPFVPKNRADVLFFVGRGEPMDLPNDTVVLDCDDTYQGLPEKIRAIIRWAYEHGYDYMLKCDDDVILLPKAVLDSGYDKFPYTGKCNRLPSREDSFTVPMGFTYWLSRECMGYLLDAPLPVNSNDDERWVAKNLYPHGINLHDDARYHLHLGGLIDPSKRPIRINRPLNNIKYRPMPEKAFAWCIFLEGNSGNRIPIEVKLDEFRKVFARHCEPRLAECSTNQP